jgi:hypothetical protein
MKPSSKTRSLVGLGLCLAVPFLLGLAASCSMSTGSVSEYFLRKCVVYYGCVISVISLMGTLAILSVPGCGYSKAYRAGRLMMLLTLSMWSACAGFQWHEQPRLPVQYEQR